MEECLAFLCKGFVTFGIKITKLFCNVVISIAKIIWHILWLIVFIAYICYISIRKILSYCLVAAAMDEYVQICVLPECFGKEAVLFSKVNKFSSGILNIYFKSSQHFCKWLPLNQGLIIEKLKNDLTADNYICTEKSILTGEYSNFWKTHDVWGYPKELVTIMEKDEFNDYKLMDAYLQNVQDRGFFATIIADIKGAAALGSVFIAVIYLVYSFCAI